MVPRGEEELADDPPFWVQSWTESYAEIDIESSFRDWSELVELVEDAGLQLASGHMSIAEPFDLVLREVQLRILDREGSRIREVIETLSQEILLLWENSQK